MSRQITKGSNDMQPAVTPHDLTAMARKINAEHSAVEEAVGVAKAAGCKALDHALSVGGMLAQSSH